MEIISKPNKTVFNIWKKPCSISNDYRLFRYVIRKEYEDKVILLNTVTGELVLLNEDESDLISSASCGWNDVSSELIEHHFLVPLECDDIKVVYQLWRVLKTIKKTKNITGYTILPTTNCNAKCFYCYESNFPRLFMTEETACKVGEYIVDNCGSQKKVSINWFGGEPLLGANRISQICDCLLKNGIDFSSSMISNGVLFTEKLVHIASFDWHLKSIQITLDGSENVYNTTKSYADERNFGNPYLRVLDNIRLLLNESIRVSIRINLDYHNLEDLFILVDDLSERFKGEKLLSIYVHTLFENVGYQPVNHSEIERQYLAVMLEKAEEHILSKGLHVNMHDERKKALPSLKYYYCMADNTSSVLINPLGQIGKCDHYIFEYLIGNIYYGGDGIDDNAQVEYWMNIKKHELCESCVLFPYCGLPKVCCNADGCHEIQAQRDVSRIQSDMVTIYKRYNNQEEGD